MSSGVSIIDRAALAAHMATRAEYARTALTPASAASFARASLETRAALEAERIAAAVAVGVRAALAAVLAATPAEVEAAAACECGEGDSCVCAMLCERCKGEGFVNDTRDCLPCKTCDASGLRAELRGSLASEVTP